MVEKLRQFDLPPGSPFQGGHHRYGVGDISITVWYAIYFNEFISRLLSSAYTSRVWSDRQDYD